MSGCYTCEVEVGILDPPDAPAIITIFPFLVTIVGTDDERGR